MEVFTFHSGKSGPAIVVTGCVHGDEPAGPNAINAFLEKWDGRLECGRATFVPVVNEAARAINQRYVDVDLNRVMGVQDLTDLAEHKIVPQLRSILAAHDVLLDLHSFRKGKIPFALIGPRNNDGGLEAFKFEEEETRLAASLGVKRVLFGWLRSYNEALLAFNEKRGLQTSQYPALEKSVGLTEFMRQQGGYACTVECGQHEDPKCTQIGVNAIKGALQGLGMASFENVHTFKSFECYELSDVLIKSQHKDGLLVDALENFDPILAGQSILIVDGKEFHTEQEGVLAMFPKAAPSIGESILTLAKPSDRLD